MNNLTAYRIQTGPTSFFIRTYYIIWRPNETNRGTDLSPSDAVSILMNPAQLMKTLGPMWHMVTSWVRFSRRVLFCLRICADRRCLMERWREVECYTGRSVHGVCTLSRWEPFLGPRPQTYCTRLWVCGWAMALFTSTPTSLTRLMNSQYRADSRSSFTTCSWDQKHQALCVSFNSERHMS